MPWQEVITMELRQQLVHDALRRVVPATELLSDTSLGEALAD